MVSDPTIHLGIHSLYDFAHTKQKALAYLEQNNLVFAPFYTCEVYACALQSVICQFNGTIDPFRSHNFPYVAYKYDPFFIDNSETSDWEKCSYQIDSIASQLQLINTRQAIGTFNLDEFRLFFDPKQHGYLPYNPPLIQTYGFVCAKEQTFSPLEIFVQNFIRQIFAPNQSFPSK